MMMTLELRTHSRQGRFMTSWSRCQKGIIEMENIDKYWKLISCKLKSPWKQCIFNFNLTQKAIIGVDFVTAYQIFLKVVSNPIRCCHTILFIMQKRTAAVKKLFFPFKHAKIPCMPNIRQSVHLAQHGSLARWRWIWAFISVRCDAMRSFVYINYINHTMLSFSAHRCKAR